MSEKRLFLQKNVNNPTKLSSLKILAPGVTAKERNEEAAQLRQARWRSERRYDHRRHDVRRHRLPRVPQVRRRHQGLRHSQSRTQS